MKSSTVRLELSEDEYSRLAQAEDLVTFVDLIFAGGKKKVRNFRSRLCDHTGLQSSYWSQVLKRKSKLSQDGFLKIALAVELPVELQMLGLKLQGLERASSHEVERLLRRELEEFRRSIASLNKRLQAPSPIRDEDAFWYVSSWIPSAVHMSCFQEKKATVVQVARQLDLPEDQVQVTMDRLVEAGLLRRAGSKFQVTERRLHFDRESIHALIQHSNWRLESARRIREKDSRDTNALHFTSVISASRADLDELRVRLVELISAFEKKLPESPDESVDVLICDLFSL